MFLNPVPICFVPDPPTAKQSHQNSPPINYSPLYWLVDQNKKCQLAPVSSEAFTELQTTNALNIRLIVESSDALISSLHFIALGNSQ